MNEDEKVTCIGCAAILVIILLIVLFVPGAILNNEAITLTGHLEKEPIVITYDEEIKLETVPQGQMYTHEWIHEQQKILDSYLIWPNLSADGEAQVDKYLILMDNLDKLTSYELNDSETLTQMLAKVVTQEIGGLTEETCYSTTQMEESAVVWCILNQVDMEYSEQYELTNAPGAYENVAEQIEAITKAPYRFAYREDRSIHDGIEEVCVDTLIRWQLEKAGIQSGRVLPCEYIFFTGDGQHNLFRKEFKGSTYWDWSLTDPYK